MLIDYKGPLLYNMTDGQHLSDSGEKYGQQRDNNKLYLLQLECQVFTSPLVFFLPCSKTMVLIGLTRKFRFTQFGKLKTPL